MPTLSENLSALAVRLGQDMSDRAKIADLGTAAATDATDYAAAGQAVPAGGTTGQVLAKSSNDDNTVEWTTAGVGDMLAANDLSDVANPVLAAGNLDLIKRSTVALLLADTVLDYSSGTGKTAVAADQIVEAQGFRYEVAASGASDHHITTAGGVKAYVLPTERGISVDAFGALGDGQKLWATASINGTTLTVPTQPFKQADVGKLIIVSGAGASSGDLITTIASFNNSSSVVLANASGTALSSVNTLLRWGTDDLAAINKAVSVSVSQPDRVKRPAVVLSGSTYFCSGRITGLANSGLALIGAGEDQTTLVFTQSGVGLEVDAFAGGSSTDPFIRMDLLDFTVEGQKTSTALVSLQGMAFSKVRLTALEGNPTASMAFRVSGCMTNDFRLTNSENAAGLLGHGQHGNFLDGLRVQAGSRAGVSVGACTDNVFWLSIDGNSIGVRLVESDLNLFHGASQANSTYGVLIAALCRANTFQNFGLENLNATADLADAGHSTKLINSYASHAVLVQAASRSFSIDGGMYERVEIAANAQDAAVDNILLGNWFTSGGGLHDSGKATTWKNLRGLAFRAAFNGTAMTVTALTQLNAVLKVGDTIVGAGIPAGTTITAFGTGTGGAGTYTLSANVGSLAARYVRTNDPIYPSKGRTAITVGASPFTWENNTGTDVDVFLLGGTVTNIENSRRGDTWAVAGIVGAVTNLVPTSKRLAKGDAIKVTYSASPGMSYIPA